MTEDPRISEIRALLDDWRDPDQVLEDIRAILDRPAPAPKAGNCVGRLCAYERALTEEYPDGTGEDSETVPDLMRAAQRVGDFLRSYGDGRVCVAITPLAEYQIPPLYGRDLQSLANLVDRESPAPRVFLANDRVPVGTVITGKDGSPFRVPDAYASEGLVGVAVPFVEVAVPLPEEWQAAVDQATDEREAELWADRHAELTEAEASEASQ